MTVAPAQSRNPWFWVPSLYLAEGIPYVIVMTVSGVLYKRLGIANADNTFYTGLIYLPWVIKPLWAPVIDMYRTKRAWIVTLQLVSGAAFAAIALAIPLPVFFPLTLAIFWLMAFSSATHDIAADGLYMLGLPQHQQAAFVGVRNTFYNFAKIIGQGLLVVVAGTLETRSGLNTKLAWSVSFAVLAVIFLLFYLYHRLLLPYPSADRSVRTREAGSPLREWVKVFALFFDRPGMTAMLAFLLLYRFAEAQLVRMVQLFLLDSRSEGGLGLSTSQVGLVYGTVGVIALTVGGLLGGYVVSRQGLRFWLWPMVLMIHLPDLVFVYLSHMQPENFLLINAAVALEQFGYGFGFTAYVLYMIMVAEGEHRTAHYAICTGIMALGMMLPGMFSGVIQEWLGYRHFFLWVMLSTVPGFIVAAMVRIDPGFGRKI